MFIRQINIVSYGMHRNKTIYLGSQPIQVFCGPNEAGKSTIMAFIRAIFFGFPMRNQKDSKYIPKDGSAYGGNIEIIQDEKRITIERFAGKSSGNALVTFENGEQDGEEALIKILKGMDVTVFQSIFSFDIHGLQGLEEIKANELGQYLFSASVTGSQALNKLEKDMHQKLDQLFKPNGKKPILNEMLETLEGEKRKIAKWQEKLNSYDQLMKESVELQECIKELEEKRKHLLSLTEHIRMKQRMKPYVEESKKLHFLLNQLPPYSPFPEDGLDRLEQINMNLLPLKGKYHSILEKEEKVKTDLDTIFVDEHILGWEEVVNKCFENKTLFEQQKTELDHLQHQLTVEVDRFRNSVHDLGVSNEEDKLLLIPTNMAIKSEIINLQSEENSLKQQKVFLEQEYRKTMQMLDEHKAKIIFYEKQQLSAEEVKALENVYNSITAGKNVSERKGHVMESLHNNEEKRKRYETKKRKNGNKHLAIGIISLCITVFVAVFVYFWAGIGFGAAVCIFLIAFRLYMNSVDNQYLAELKKEREQFHEELSELEKQFINQGPEEEQSMQQKLIENENVKQYLRNEKFLYHNKEDALKKLSDELAELESKLANVKQDTARLASVLGIRELTSPAGLLELFEQLKEMKETIRTCQKLREEHRMISAKVDEYEKHLSELGTVFQLEMSHEHDETILQKVRQILKNQYELLQKRTVLETDLQQLQIDKKDIHRQITLYENECSILFEKAEVTAEEEFRSKGKANQDALMYKEQMQVNEAQCRSIAPAYNTQLRKEIETDTINYEHKLKDIRTEYENVENKISMLKERVAGITFEISNLEEDASYSELMHRYEMKRSQFQSVAKQWAVYQVSKSLVEKTKEFYRNVRLPKVMETASNYFSFLTENKYTAIALSPKTEEFLVVRGDGARFNVSELSQGTKEQLYLAIRFSLANSFHSDTAFPFIIDDSFVNFDSFRLKRTMELLKTIATKRQILFFTCHVGLLTYFDEKQIINL